MYTARKGSVKKFKTDNISQITFVEKFLAVLYLFSQKHTVSGPKQNPDFRSNI